LSLFLPRTCLDDVDELVDGDELIAANIQRVAYIAAHQT